MGEMEKYYQILGLKPEASGKEILEAYRVLIQVWNPSRFSDDPNIQKIATEKIKEIDEAFKQILIWTDGRYEKGKEIPEPQMEVRTEPPGTRGSVVIQTEPSEAEVYFNEKFVGTSPCKGKHLPVGSYRVRVIKEGYQIWEQDVEIYAGAEKEVFAKLKLKEPESGNVWTDPYLGIEFVYVKGGRFEMGDTFGDGDIDEKPVHEVQVEDFYIGKYLVTQGQWEKVMGNNPSEFRKGGNYPVEKVSWHDTQEFIKRLSEKTEINYRLPTEAEWEYAARSGGKKEKWAGTNSETEIGEYAWYWENSSNETHPVGQKKPNGVGLYDMSGNVFEWVQDWYSNDYHRRNSPTYNPQCKEFEYGRRKVIRGGMWQSGPMSLRTTGRSSTHPIALHGVGFRLVLPAQPEQPFRTEKEQPSLSEGKPDGTPQPSQEESLYEPSSKPPPREDLKASVASRDVVRLEYAGFWKRFAAFAIDYILVFIVTCFIFLIGGWGIGMSKFLVMESIARESGIRMSELLIMGSIALGWLYWAFMESSSKQATLGKMALGVIVTDYKGRRVSFGRATGRQLARFISSFLLIGYIMAGFTEKKQALHDMVAECLVVVKK